MIKFERRDGKTTIEAMEERCAQRRLAKSIQLARANNVPEDRIIKSNEELRKWLSGK